MSENRSSRVRYGMVHYLDGDLQARQWQALSRISSGLFTPTVSALRLVPLPALYFRLSGKCHSAK